MSPPIPRRVVPSSTPCEATPAQVEREFRRRLRDGMRIHAAGTAKRGPLKLLAAGYTPKYRIDLFDTVFYLTNIRQNDDIRFFVAYVVQTPASGGPPRAYPRIFYKDVSLIWRSASHFVRSAGENWIGKGEMGESVVDGVVLEHSLEQTTDLPLEIQTALETVLRRARRVARDEKAIAMILRRGHDDRIEPYRDFVEPRRRARADSRNLVNGGRPVAWFTRPGDPASLRFATGYQPDFGRGVLEVSHSKSRLYHGRLGRYRILSRNRRIQYLFFAGPRHVWIIPPQATTTELTSYGVRTIDVVADEDAFIPGYEYHFVDETGPTPELVSQIPEGYAGEPSVQDPSRADASAWLDELPVIREFRRRVPTRRR